MTAMRRGLVVGRRQGVVADEGDDGGPVVEDFTGELADFFGVVIAMELAGPFQPSLDGVEDDMASATAVIRLRSSRTSHSPKRTPSGLRPPARARPLRIR